ncbi:spore germination protein GerPB [Pseudalkalibacillus caeni]|uniref:Spore gernimation protein KA n=1 Tax=Exobacillus caeni TaxID=2574798 RepID=A0A5R9F666_9BACL|nr:spore germination protein GerPB [Pseudalkalibacillus caeni]TLS37989.1 spore gernimation protein KA [Pseudalkalibacillus caeni]
MNLFVNQNIVIHSLKIEGITNSSVLQIGSAGIIKTLSNLYNTGGYTEPAPEIEPPVAPPEIFVPLTPPTPT